MLSSQPNQLPQFFYCEAKYVSKLGITLESLLTDVTCFVFFWNISVAGILLTPTNSVAVALKSRYECPKKSKMSSFESTENIHKKEDGSYYVVSANKVSSVTLLRPGNESQRNIMQFCEFQIGSQRLLYIKNGSK